MQNNGASVPDQAGRASHGASICVESPPSGDHPSRAKSIAAKLRRIVAEEADYPEGFALPKNKQRTILSAAELLEGVTQPPAGGGLLAKRLRADAEILEQEGHPIRAARVKLAASAIEGRDREYGLGSARNDQRGSGGRRT